jgi:cytochrome c oxidase subunit 3
MALAVEAARIGNKAWLLIFFTVTWTLGMAFLAIEGYEYYSKFIDHLIPGTSFHFAGTDPGASELFFCLYFTMTGIHMFHMFVGLVLITWFAAWTAFSRHALTKRNCFEVLGLYWAFVDIVWLFLYPLFYLVNPQ